MGVLPFPTSCRALCLILWLSVITACGGVDEIRPDGGAPAPDAGVFPDPDAGPSYEDADWLFEPGRLLTIEIEMAPEDWNFIRFQSRSIIEIFGPTCGEQPAYSPFTYRPATVTVEGQTFEQVGVRKKGFLGSLDEQRPSLKIKFHEYLPNQHLSGLKRMTLNNNKQDPSQLNQCLGYLVFERAGVPAPRCNFATVSLNGEPLGVYTHVESVKKPFLGRHFADNDGNLYEGTLSDFRDGWMATFERKTNKSVPPGTEDRSDLQAVRDVLDQSDDAAMLADLESLVDVDAFYSFWAVETLTAHWDGYAGNNNNYYLYADPATGKFTFMPWGIDQLFGGGIGGDAGLTRSAITRRLWMYTPSRQALLQRFGEVLDQAWDDGDMLDEIDRMQTLIAGEMPADQLLDFNAAVSGLRASIDGREAFFRDRIATASIGDADDLSAPLCFDDVGDLSATFTVTYNGGGSPTATMDITIDGATVPLSSFAAFAGPDDEVQGKSVLYITAQVDPVRTAIAVVSLPDGLVNPGTLEAGTAQVESFLLFLLEGQEEAEAVYFLSGTITLDSGAPATGSSWQGSLDMDLWDPPWF